MQAPYQVDPELLVPLSARTEANEKHLWEKIKSWGSIFSLYIIFQIPEEIRQTEGELVETKNTGDRSIGPSDSGIMKLIIK